VPRRFVFAEHRSANAVNVFWMRWGRVGTLSNWIARIGTAFKRPSEHLPQPTSPPLPVTDESGPESAVPEDTVVEDTSAATVEVEDRATATVEAEDNVAATVVVDDNAAATVEAEDRAAAPVVAEETAVPAEVEPGQKTRIPVTSSISPDQQEIQRRRELVRALFNDFWRGNDDKPLTFADRLNQAEAYLNERLIERGESWQLDPATRKMLGLPPRAN
jgi:hypothetical protein